MSHDVDGEWVERTCDDIELAQRFLDPSRSARAGEFIDAVIHCGCAGTKARLATALVDVLDELASLPGQRETEWKAHVAG